MQRMARTKKVEVSEEAPKAAQDKKQKKEKTDEKPAAEETPKKDDAKKSKKVDRLVGEAFKLANQVKDAAKSLPDDASTTTASTPPPKVKTAGKKHKKVIFGQT